MVSSCNKLLKLFYDKKNCIQSDIAKFLFRNKTNTTMHLEGCRIFVKNNKYLYNTLTYYGNYALISDSEYKGIIKSYPDSSYPIFKQIKTGLDRMGKMQRESDGTDYHVHSEMVKLGDCNDNSKQYIIEKREVFEKFNKRNNYSFYAFAYKRGNIKIVYDENYNIESIAMFKDPLSNSKNTFDPALTTLVENILSHVATWDNKANRFIHKKVYDPINAEGEIVKLMGYLKKYHK
jgi:hypothetical protein